MKLIIKNGRIIDPSQELDQIGHIIVADGIVQKIIPASDGSADAILQAEEADARIIDAQGMWVVPGFIDTHVHLREPGMEYKEDIKSGCESAAAGGFTGLCSMPNTKPFTDTVETVEYIKQKNAEANGVKVYPSACITLDQAGKELTDMEALKAAGVCGFSEDGKSVMDLRVMKKAMEMAKSLDMPILDHTEQAELVKGGAMHKGAFSEMAGVKGIAAEVEEMMTARDILLAKETGCRLHLQHISKAGSFDLIRLAKSWGMPVTSETAPHYFTLTDKDVVVMLPDQGDAEAKAAEKTHYSLTENGAVVDSHKKMNPPLGSEKDMYATLRAIIDGTVDCIATDHAPHAPEEKARPLHNAPFGVIGLETSFAVSYTQLVKTEYITPMRLIELMSTNPAKILGVAGGTLRPGSCADIAVIDIEKTYTVPESGFKSKSVNTPFAGMTVTGEIVMTVADGKVIYER